MIDHVKEWDSVKIFRPSESFDSVLSRLGKYRSELLAKMIYARLIGTGVSCVKCKFRIDGTKTHYTIHNFYGDSEG